MTVRATVIACSMRSTLPFIGTFLDFIELLRHEFRSNDFDYVEFVTDDLRDTLETAARCLLRTQ